jgi:2-hydroxychromene-2-carboxylate isomerase
VVCNARANLFPMKLRALAGFLRLGEPFYADFRPNFDLHAETLSRYEPKRWRKGLQPRLEFYFDCSSPWTYLAFVRLLKLANRVPVDLVWKPILVGGVFNKVNGDVYKQRDTPNPVKAAYYRKDLADWAAFAGVTIIQPSVFPVRSVTAMRACFHAIEHNKLVAFASALFEAYWGEDRDISLDAEIKACARRSGLDSAQLLADAASPAAKAALIANTDELIARGGFGSPTFYVEGSGMFFGNDRLELVEAALLAAKPAAKVVGGELT